MKPYEFKRVYHPKLGRYVYKHKGSGIIVDNILKQLRKFASNSLNKIVDPSVKKSSTKRSISSRRKTKQEKNRKYWRFHHEKTIIDEEIIII